MTSETSDLVYVAICSTCNKEYIGKAREGKQGLKAEFEFIDNTSINHNINN